MFLPKYNSHPATCHIGTMTANVGSQNVWELATIQNIELLHTWDSISLDRMDAGCSIWDF